MKNLFQKIFFQMQRNVLNSAKMFRLFALGASIDTKLWRKNSVLPTFVKY